jgi:thioredoxin-dependent peroxiredoxin
MVELNLQVPTFSFEATSQLKGTSNDFNGKNLVLYFYPKDATPGCTTESQNFRDNYPAFKQLNTEVFGLSRDSLASHEKFKEKQKLPFELISDEDESICNLFDVIKQKSMFGKKYMGIERSTFIINKKGELIFEQRKVKVKNHVNEILDFLKEM